LEEGVHGVFDGTTLRVWTFLTCELGKIRRILWVIEEFEVSQTPLNVWIYFHQKSGCDVYKASQINGVIFTTVSRMHTKCSEWAFYHLKIA